LIDTSKCLFAHNSKDFKHEAPDDFVYCVAFDTSAAPSSSGISGLQSIASSKLFSSTDFFQNDKRIEDLGIGKNAKGVIALAVVSKFAVAALKDMSPGNNGEMLLYVTVDTKTWAQARFPHASSATLRENGYTIVESTTHSLAVDVVLQESSAVGTLFVSNSNGTFFTESLKDTNRNEYGYVDFETLYGVEGIGISNVVLNAKEVETRRQPKKLVTRITFDDGVLTISYRITAGADHIARQGGHGDASARPHTTSLATAFPATRTPKIAACTCTASLGRVTPAVSSRPPPRASSWALARSGARSFHTKSATRSSAPMLA
jgi:hypothetical protein